MYASFGLAHTGLGRPLYSVTRGNFQLTALSRNVALFEARRLARLSGGRVVLHRC